MWLLIFTVCTFEVIPGPGVCTEQPPEPIEYQTDVDCAREGFRLRMQRETDPNYEIHPFRCVRVEGRGT
jgi:hypothetical protein